MNAAFLTAALALTAALCWGAGDFSGGLAARRSDAFRAVFFAYCVGLVAMLIIALARGEKLTTPADLVWGALAGLSGMVGVGSLWRGFTVGRMGIVAPLSAVLSAALPVLFEGISRGLPQPVQMVGFAAALTGIWLLARPERLSGRPRGLGLAVLAGIGFGGFFIGLGQVSQNAVFWPLAAARAACVGVMAAFALATRRPVSLQHSPLGLFFLAGVLDVAGNLFFLLAVQSGRLDITAVLGSLYPAVTALAAWWVIKERMTRLQVFGVCMAVLAIILITL